MSHCNLIFVWQIQHLLELLYALLEIEMLINNRRYKCFPNTCQSYIHYSNCKCISDQIAIWTKKHIANTTAHPIHLHNPNIPSFKEQSNGTPKQTYCNLKKKTSCNLKSNSY